MNAKLSRFDRTRIEAARLKGRSAFTLLELLMVISIISILVVMMGTFIGQSVRRAREAATVALLQKIDVLIDERIKGFDRATKSPDFQRIVATLKKTWESNGIYGSSPKVIAAVARKDFFRQNFPQRFEDLGNDGEDLNLNGVIDVISPGVTEDRNGDGILDNNNGIATAPSNAVPDVLEQVPGVNLAKLQQQGPAIPTNPYAATAQRDVTESSELLYYMVTRMQVFGVPPVGESDFSTSEVRDTDGDGLMEFVDGWGRPLRFYRWPTRLLKPNGPFGADGKPGIAGVDDDNDGITDNFSDYGFVGADDVSIGLSTVPYDMRTVAGLLIDGLPSKPALPLQQWDVLSEDPDDPYGLIVTDIARLSKSNINVLPLFSETSYPTLDTYHTPLVVSAGADGDLGLFEPNQGTASGTITLYGPGALDADLGVLAQPKHGPGGPFDITSSVLTALTDNLTNRNRRAGKGK